MSNHVFAANDRHPLGATVEIYDNRGVRHDGRSPLGSARPVATVTIKKDPVRVEGLKATPHVAYALVDGQHRYTNFSPRD